MIHIQFCALMNYNVDKNKNQDTFTAANLDPKYTILQP